MVDKTKVLLYSTVFGVLLGLLVGYIMSLFNFTADDTLPKLIFLPGELFIRTLKMLVLLLVAAAITSSVANMGRVGQGKLGVYALLWYTSTTTVACISGQVWIHIFQPWKFYEGSEGQGKTTNENDEQVEYVKRDTLESMLELIKQMFPSNFVEAGVELNLLGIIIGAFIMGIVLTKFMDAKDSKPLLEIIESLNQAVTLMVNWVIWASPVGVFSLVAYNLGISGNFIGVFKGLGVFIACRFFGIIFHGLITLPLIYFIATRKNPIPYMQGMIPAYLIAFGTSSSAAVLPISIKCVEEKNLVHPAIARFVCSTGATVNMDAAAIAYSMSPIFIHHVLGIPLSFGNIVAIVLTATLISMGAAAIPSPGLTNYIAVLTAINLPVDQSVAILAPILTVDWLEDRLMTVVNIEGDAFGAGAIAHWMRNDFTEEHENPIIEEKAF